MFDLSRTFEVVNKRNPAKFCAGFLVIWLFLGSTIQAQGLESHNMKAPKSSLVSTFPRPVAVKQSSTTRSALLGNVRFFQKWISPIDGPRCRFSPTCSQFGYEAVHEYGSLWGVVMTADRLMRCSYWTEPGSDYIRLPSGALHDPVAHNQMSQQ
jgi:putative membrane protein insertion efficiency factor